MSVDVDASANMVGAHPNIDFLLGDSASPAMVSRVRSILPNDRGTLFAILDSDHSKAHVLRELDAWSPLLKKGDYLVVEDTCVNGHPVRPQFGPGPYEAVGEFMAKHSGEFVNDALRESKFGFTAAPRGYFIRA
jgi:cephalosporin hydroxylase